jgi:hypothetical protein
MPKAPRTPKAAKAAGAGMAAASLLAGGLPFSLMKELPGQVRLSAREPKPTPFVPPTKRKGKRR